MDKNPDAFRTISEAAEELDLPQHVLRFWETRFSQIRPMKRSGGRRYYRTQDVELLAAIRHLLYGEGYTIKGVQRILKQQGTRAVVDLVAQLRDSGAGGAGLAGLAQSAVAAEPPAEASNDAAVREPEGLMETAGAPGAGESSGMVHPPANIANTPIISKTAMTLARQPPGGGLTATEVGLLRSVLEDLAECRRVLDAAQAGHQA